MNRPYMQQQALQARQGPFQSVGLAAVAKFWGAGTAVLTRRCPPAAWLQSSPPRVTRGSRLNSLKPQLASGPRLCHPSQGKASDRCANSSCGLFRKARLGEGQGRQAVGFSGQRAAMSLPYDAGIRVIHAPGDSASPAEKQLSSITTLGGCYCRHGTRLKGSPLQLPALSSQPQWRCVDLGMFIQTGLVFLDSSFFPKSHLPSSCSPVGILQTSYGLQTMG